MKLPFVPYFSAQRERESERADVRFSLSKQASLFIGFLLPHGQTESCKWTTQLRENKDDYWCDDDDDDCLSSMRVFVVVLDEREKREEKW